MRDTTSRGDLAEWHVATALLDCGKRLLRPVSNAMRYDLLVDNEDGTFTRIQCKAGVLRQGRIVFRLYSVSGHRGTRERSYDGDVDAFGVYCPQTRGTYLVPMAEFSGQRTAACLRIDPARNSQRKRIRLASDFLIGASG